MARKLCFRGMCKNCSDIMARNVITAKHIFHRISIVMEKPLVKWVLVMKSGGVNFQPALIFRWDAYDVTNKARKTFKLPLGQTNVIYLLIVRKLVTWCLYPGHMNIKRTWAIYFVWSIRAIHSPVADEYHCYRNTHTVEDYWNINNTVWSTYEVSWKYIPVYASRLLVNGYIHID